MCVRICMYYIYTSMCMTSVFKLRASMWLVVLNVKMIVMHAWVYVCMYVSKSICVYMCVYIYLCIIYMHKCMYIYIYVHIYTYVYMHIYTYEYIHTQYTHTIHQHKFVSIPYNQKHMCTPPHTNIHVNTCLRNTYIHTNKHTHTWHRGVAATSRLLKIICLFCKRALQKRRYSAKETYDFEQPTNRSHPINNMQDAPRFIHKRTSARSSGESYMHIYFP